MKILISLNSSWNIYNFRSGLIRSFLAAGHQVVAVCPDDGYVDRISELGCRVRVIAMDGQGTNPIREGRLFLSYCSIIWSERPHVYLGYTVKPNVYGSIAAHLCSVPVINNIAGLGAVYIGGGWMRKLVSQLYRLALSRSKMVFFQNEDDRSLFISMGLTNAARTDLLPGSGIDLLKFSCSGAANQPRAEDMSESFRFLLVGRMLWDKGVGEYVEAARSLQMRYPRAVFCLLGFLDSANPAAISRAQMREWENEGFISYLGESDDVRKELLKAHCVVLPSYREGAPRTLLEASAMCLPVVATNVPGCNRVVEDGVTGFLCEPRSAVSLALCLERMLSMSVKEREEMGHRGRRKMELEFDERFVIDKYQLTIQAICSSS
ncbi:MAG: glycosyltransferase family 4 protein [Aquabacterium sp.]|nr:glycosyltransferase family 4 protein [Aquabacterium sp.]